MEIVREPGGVTLPLRGHQPHAQQSAFIAENAILIGDVQIGERSSIWYSCVLRADLNAIRIGADTNIQDGTIIHVDSRQYSTHIGDRVTVGHMALLHACTLQDDCMVGMRATVMDGALVETGAMVAAGALVTPGKQVPSGEVWAGSPAKFMRAFDASDADMLTYIWEEYRDLGVEYTRAGSDLRRFSRTKFQTD
ncbi:MAG: gamma carbonic anhydrase family protein [Rhodospirillaceae bacterium]